MSHPGRKKILWHTEPNVLYVSQLEDLKLAAIATMTGQKWQT